MYKLNIEETSLIAGGTRDSNLFEVAKEGYLRGGSFGAAAGSAIILALAATNNTISRPTLYLSAAITTCAVISSVYDVACVYFTSVEDK